MKFGDAAKQFAEGKLKPYILFHGEDEYLKTEGVAAALATLHITTPELNISMFEERPDASAVAAAMETLPFMSERRAILIRNTDILTSTCAADFSEKIAVAQLPESNHLIISLRGKADKRKGLYKKIAKEGMVVECDALSDAALADFAMNAARQNNLLLSRTDALLLCEYCDGDLNTVVNEIKKLSYVCAGNITKKEIEQYTSKSAQYSVFRIHDLLCAGKLKEAKSIIDKMLVDDANPIGFLTLVANNFKQMLVARACRDAKFPPAKTIACVMDETGAKEWLAQKALKNCVHFPAPKLRDCVYRLGRLDYMAKQGEVVLKTDLFALLAGLYHTNI